MKRNLISAAAIALSVSASLVSCGSKDASQQGQAPAPSLAVMTVSEGDSQSDNEFPATIKGKTDVDVRPLVSGFITKVHVDEGDVVKKGQVLFTLDQVQLQAAVDQAQQQVNAATTAVNTAKLTADSKRKLFDKNIISEYEWSLANNDLQNAKAQLANAQAALTSARKNLSYATVTAPSDGVVGTINLREGALASPSGQALTTVSDISQVYAYFSLTEKDILSMTEGKSLQEAIKSMPAVQLRLADGTIYSQPGHVATVSGVIDPATGAASVRALFPNPDRLVRSGSTGKVVIPRDMHNVIVIPQKATYELQDRKFVYVVNDSNAVASVPVTVMPNNDGRTYVVTSGLQPGQRIVVEGVGSSVRDGMVINPVEGAPQAEGAEAAPAAPQSK
ncbi:MAG: efflux RND transporter periplasmic adaptor subunit [Bacteroides sp.]|nr:efflux RND transporter periplasmic adaptor subunit [Bacteroidales bacterium]MBD5316792.1 efflux RND transporter periplasmic adaptor subunit [Bacteroides sp.]MBD5378073.1 efflux RND transporter periplasmic adaptor subunit [Bacteroides sp.]